MVSKAVSEDAWWLTQAELEGRPSDSLARRAKTRGIGQSAADTHGNKPPYNLIHGIKKPIEHRSIYIVFRP
jgi:hypothetical protein